jgi:hypothetical protein
MYFFSIEIDPTLIKGVLRIAHFIGLALGLGIATFLDLLMLRFMVRTKIRAAHVQAFNFGTKIVIVGLILLWISGLSFLVYYFAVEPEKLSNPKIWAKISIVGVLTANAVYLHKIVLPVVEQQVSRSLFCGLTIRQRLLMLIGGATSATCWYVPVALAAIPQFNNSVPANEIWAVFCALLVGVNAVVAMGLFGGTALSALIARRSSHQAAWGKLNTLASDHPVLVGAS